MSCFPENVSIHLVLERINFICCFIFNDEESFKRRHLVPSCFILLERKSGDLSQLIIYFSLSCLYAFLNETSSDLKYMYFSLQLCKYTLKPF